MPYVESGSRMILGLQDKDWKEIKSLVAQSAMELQNYAEAHEDGCGNLNEGQRGHRYKYTIGHSVRLRKFQRAKKPKQY